MAERLQHFEDVRRDFAPYGFTCEVWEPRKMPRADRHDEIELNFLDCGRLVYLIGGQRVTVEAKQLTVFWAAIPHQIVEFENVSFYYVLTVPFGLMLQWGLPEEFVKPLLMGEAISSSATDFALDSHLFEQWHRDMRDAPNVNREILTLEVRSRLLRLAQKVSTRDNPPQPIESPRSMVRSHLEIAESMACYVAKHYTSRIRVADVAEHVGYHPDYATNIFREVFGTTLVALVTRHRIAHAQRQLATTRDSIVKVCNDSGFDTLSRFNRAFKQLTGMTPSGFRKSCI